MIVETFRNGDAVPVYRRLRDRGHQTVDGLRYHGSWVTRDLTRCYQIMECEDLNLLNQWMAIWNDVVALEVVPVTTSADAVAAIAPRL